MGPVRPSATAFVGCALLAALVCVARLPDLPVSWWAVALLAALYVGCEQLPLPRALGRTRAGRTRTSPGGHRALEGMGTFYPVLLAGAFLLPPAAAAFVPLPGALLAHVAERPSWLRRGWRAARLALAVWAASRVHWSLGGHGAVVGPHFPHALLTAGAAVVAFCLVLTVLDGGILALGAGAPPASSRQRGRAPARTAWRGLFLRSLAPVAVHGLAGLMMAVLWRSPYGPVTALLVLLPMYVSCWAFAQYHRERAAHQATIRALVQAVDLKDGYTRGHSERVGQASMMIARELGLDDRRVEVLRFAGILHDVGKLGVPTRLLRKDGPLTPEERRIIELHPEYGHEIVRGIGFLGEARSAILHHHERLDGTGYPYGLRGRQIPEPARVVAVADAFDAMTSTRSYRRARPVAAALEELRRCAGTQFDPAMVDALIRALERWGCPGPDGDGGGRHPAVTADEQHGNVPPPVLPLAGQPAGRGHGGGGA
ncbi:HD-GYP domain-containing protein [Streptomyces sp. NPDC093261]|uniref:HD-GYP domain-containing protein n=1 Tax=Streptomyces sp. NPDC093261 TaxID=3366037 RepID=UPI00381D6843